MTARRAYGELDRTQVVSSLHALARRVGVQQVTMRELAAELGAAVPSVYYHVPGKQAALDLLAESVLAGIPVPDTGPWDIRLAELYCAAREVMLDVTGHRRHPADPRRRGARPPPGPAQPFAAGRSRGAQSRCRGGAHGALHLPAGLGQSGRSPR
ncbi:TetR family transcriptional regulator [Mycobacterium sp. TY815]|uniref:TetR family transcriptional regulator n=1 Tax=Mycobacterium sp. TY815 TaxID=3050581 RepID=UPI0027423BDB|nr:TetR family transcriptional regulator [Mycobacterium sp. TY815]MDP7701284.1 TetR family transcriptional regulator [Mycobacterium sp. TY815]